MQTQIQKQSTIFFFGIPTQDTYLTCIKNHPFLVCFVTHDSPQLPDWLSQPASSRPIQQLIHHPSTDTFKQFLNAYHLMFLGPIHVIECPTLSDTSRGFYQQLTQVLNLTQATYQTDHQTLTYHSQLLAYNGLANLDILKKAINLQTFHLKYKQHAAAVIGAGPSLSSKLDWLKTSQSSLIMIATDTALPVLIQNEIRPDFVITLDFRKQNARHFENFEDTLVDIPLVSAFSATPTLLSAYPGPIGFVSTGTVSDRFLLGQASEFPLFSQAGSVTHLAYKWAQYLGCKPIFFVGLDLCFSSDHQYASQTRKKN